MAEAEETANALRAFDDWWNTKGKFVDPDDSAVPWYDKRKESAGMTWLAARDYYQGQWVPIRTEADLPKKSGEYLVTMHTPSTDRHITTLTFWDFVLGIQDEEARHRRLKLDNWMPYRDGNYAIAWMLLPEPYALQEKPE